MLSSSLCAIHAQTSKMFYIFVNQTRLMQLLRWKIKPLVPWDSMKLAQLHTYTYIFTIIESIPLGAISNYTLLTRFYIISDIFFFTASTLASRTRWATEKNPAYYIQIFLHWIVQNVVHTELARKRASTLTIFNGLLTVFHWISGIKSFTRQCQI